MGKNKNDLTLAELEKKKLSIKVMYFNRFLMIRYLTATFFFININWLALMLYHKSSYFFVPLSLILLIAFPIFEQIKLYRTHKSEAILTKRYYQIQLIINLMLIVSTVTPIYEKIFFFMNQDVTGRLFVTSMLIVGIALCLTVIKRINKIEKHQDKQYSRVKDYEKIVGI
mgnify:CR=1 FL=1